MTASVYERVLGSSIDGLEPELRAYLAAPDAGLVGVGRGTFEVAGSRLRWLRPVLVFLAWRGVLFPEFGRDVPFDIVNTPRRDGSLAAVRTFHFPGRDRSLVDEMRVVDGRLHDFVGRRGGLEARFVLAAEGATLRMTSDRTWLRVARARLRLPSIFAARVELVHSWADGSQHVDVRLRHPLLGEVFVYRGSFEYRYETA